MKRFIVISLTIAFSLTGLYGVAQEATPDGKEAGKTKSTEDTDIKVKNGKYATIEIQTSAICDMCKERIENELAYTKGVRYAVLDPETKLVRVEYNPAKTDPDKIRLAISGIGYDADSVMADQEAHDKLPACCQKGTTPH